MKPTSKRFGCATLLAFDLVLFAPLLATHGVFSSHDFVRAQYPWRGTAYGVLEAENRLLSDPAASGETTLVRYRDFPRGLFWDPWVSAGAIGPFHLAQGFLSPFVALPALLLPESGIETGVLFLKFSFAFVAMYAFLRSRRFSDVAAAAGAATWAFATGQTVWGLWMQSSVSVTYPLLLLAVDRAFEGAFAARAVRFASLSILLCLAGGFPHWILYGAFAGGLYVLMRTLEMPRSAGKALLRLAAGAAIAAAILLPSILATGRFLRASGYAQLRRGMGPAHPLPLRHLRLYFLPDYQGSPRRDDYRGVGWIPGDNYVETAVGVGLAAGGLAFVGLAALRRRSEARFAAVLAAAVAIPLYAGGPLLSAIGGLPLIDISLFARAKILILLAVGILAACGTELLEKLAEVPGDGLRALAVRSAPFLVAVPLAFFALDFYPECRPDEAVFRDTPGIRRLRQETSGGGRFAAAGWTLIPNVSEALRLDDVRGHFLLDASYRRLLAAADPECFGHYGTYLVFDPRTLDPAAPVLDLLGVRVLAAPPGASSPVGSEVEARDSAPFQAGAVSGPIPAEKASPAWNRIYDGPDMTLFERPRPMPRFFFARAVLPGGVEETARADRDTISSTVFVAPEDFDRLEATASARGAGGSIRILDLRPEGFALETESRHASLLASTQKRFPPYWRTYVDGRETPSFPADGLFLGLELPPGRHRVEGRFVVPRGEAAISVLGLLALGAVLVRARNLPESTRT